MNAFNNIRNLRKFGWDRAFWEEFMRRRPALLLLCVGALGLLGSAGPSLGRGASELKVSMFAPGLATWLAGVVAAR